MLPAVLRLSLMKSVDSREADAARMIARTARLNTNIAWRQELEVPLGSFVPPHAGMTPQQVASVSRALFIKVPLRAPVEGHVYLSSARGCRLYDQQASSSSSSDHFSRCEVVWCCKRAVAWRARVAGRAVFCWMGGSRGTAIVWRYHR